MKKITCILCALLANILFAKAQTNNIIYSEIPGAIGYAAIAFAANGSPLNNQNITLRASILKGSITGSVEYQETHSVDTRDDGYFEISIGQGTWTAGNHTSIRGIDWAADQYFLKMEIDVTGGYNFGAVGTEAFCSVPYAFHSSVADSIPGVDMDSLRMAVAAANACGCSLQTAYNNGSPVNLNTTQNGINITNSVYGGTSLFSEVTNATGTPGFFWLHNSTNVNYALGAQHSGNGNALQLITALGTNINPSLNILQNGLGSAIQTINSNPNATNPGITSFYSGKSDGALFSLNGPNSTVPGVAAVKAEVQNINPPNTLSGAGIFLINEPDNTAPVLFSENKGSGAAGIFHLYSTNGIAQTNGVDIVNSCNSHVGGGSTHGLFADKSGLGPGSAGYFVNSNTSNLFSNYTVQIDHKGTGGNLYLWKWSNANTTQVLTNSLPVLNLVNTSNAGNCIQMQQVLAANPHNAIECYNTGMGNAALFLSGPAISGTPLSDVIEIEGHGYHYNRGLYVRLIDPTHTHSGNALEIASDGKGSSIRAYTTTALASGKYVAHFTTNNITSTAATIFAESNAIAPTMYSVKTGQGVGSVFSSTSSNYSIMNYNTGSGPGLFSWSNSQTGMAAFTSGTNTYAVYGATNSTNYLTSWAGYFYGRVNITGNFSASGTKNAVVKNSSGQAITTYCEESSEVWFTDYGSAQLQNGSVTVSIPQDFLETINTSETYFVYIQPEGDSKGLFVNNKASATFDVKEAQGGTSSINFSYRIVAKRKYFEDLRLASPDENQQATYSNLQTVWPELITEADDKFSEDIDYINNHFDTNPVVTTPTPDAPHSIPSLPSSPSSSNNNSESVQQSNPYIQNVDTNPPPH